LSFLATSFLVVMPACKREDAQIRELTQKAAEADKTTQQISQEGAEQQKLLTQAGVNDIRPSSDTMQLTDEQKKVLEERIKNEKNSSYQALLQEVIDKDKEIGNLNTKLNKLKAELPKPDIARPGDSHYALAMRFLRRKGVPEAEARKLVSRVNIMEKLAPGFEVYHFYANGVYGTWVSQGRARISPSDLVRQDREKVEGERDEAIAQSEKLQEDLDDLQQQKQKIQEEIASLQDERAKLIDERTKLQADNATQLASLNSIHYLVGSRDKLKQEGIIEIPIFAKDRAGKNWRDDVFNQSLDLRTGHVITIKASEVGLKKIGKINVVPGSYIRDEHYKLTLSEDKQTATIDLLTPARFKNDKVVFAVSE
jgi:predicted nuclease with TOPRIM domain